MSAIRECIDDVKTAPRNVKLMVLAFILVALQYQPYWTAYMIVIENNFGTVQLGNLNSFNSIMLALFAIPVGLIANKVGFKRMLIYGFLMNTIGMALVVITKNIYVAYLCVALQGPGSAAWDFLPVIFINDNTTAKQRTSVYSLMFAFNNLVPAIVALGSGSITVYITKLFGVSEVSGYAYFFVGAMIASCISLVPILLMKNVTLRLPEKKEKRSFIKDFKEVANKDVICYLCHIGLIGLGLGLFTPYFSNFFKSSLKLSPVTIGSITSLNYFAMFIGMALCPIIEKKFGRIGGIVYPCLASVPFMILMATCDSFGGAMMPILVVSYFFRCGLVNSNRPLTDSQIYELVPKEKKATVGGIQSTFRSGLIAVSGVIAGRVMSIKAFTVAGINLDGYRIGYFIAAILYTLACVILFKGLYKKYNRPQEKEVEAETANATV
ncbi:MFS transporter [Hathewaya histolytica]|uniref:MFS transporter n=1 Tax=Hathewaya histolytica TaxID=1498 RepID=UPI003B67FEB3